MKRSINRWTMSLATAGVLALPVTSFAKASQEPAPQQQQQQQQQPQPAQPQPAQPQPEQPPAQPQPTPQPQPATPQPTEPQTPRPTTSAAQSTPEQTVTPQEHLRQAQAAVKDISANSVPSKNRSDLNKLKQHLSNLEKMGSSSSASASESTPTRPGANQSASAPKANWGTEVGAIDKIISEMVGSETSSSSTATSTPGATGTSGAAKSSTAIDDATRVKLMEVRTHITAYAAGMAGTPSTPKTEATNTAASPAAAAGATESAASPSAASPSAASPSAASPSTASSSATPSSPQSPTAGSQNPPSTQPDPNAAAQQPPADQQPAAGQAAIGAQPPVNADEAHRHLVTARDALSQLTQLPAAAQLNGEARTQVAQLISNFNELIGNPPDWHVSYQKVAANLTTLLGPDNSDAEAQGGAPTTATGATAAPGTPAAPGATPTPGAAATPGAVGTSGTASVELDPSIRAKLVEFRRSLNQFEKAAGAAK
jgi:hypothetical protein